MPPAELDSLIAAIEKRSKADVIPRWEYDHMPRILAALTQARADREARDKLQAFKDWVHTYLDQQGVPHHPPGTHGAAGCRIGDRMDWLMAELAALRADNEALAKGLADQIEERFCVCDKPQLMVNRYKCRWCTGQALLANLAAAAKEGT